jgi:hypothetical protein
VGQRAIVPVGGDQRELHFTDALANQQAGIGAHTGNDQQGGQEQASNLALHPSVIGTKC